MYIDSHCHLNFEAFEDDYKAVVKQAQEAGVEKMIVVGTDLPSSKRAVEIAEELDGIYATVGFHPHHCKGFEGPVEELKKKLKELAKSKKAVAIGECGLDYYVYQKTKYEEAAITRELKNLQKRVFGMQIELAKELELPLVVHNRQAEEDILDAMDHFCKSDGKVPKGVFHCISGSRDYLEKVLKMGFYAGVDGNVTYDKTVESLARKIPWERLLIETDSPFLTPEPLRTKNKGKKLRNEPISVKITARFLAELKKVSLDKIETSTTKNAEVLFNI